MAKIIGLTGGIGSGKSTIANALRAEGYYVYDTDEAAKCILDENLTCREQVAELLGAGAYLNGKYNKAYVAEQVFRDKQLLVRLNAIVHPLVFADMQQCANELTADVMFAESAILFESGMERSCDAVVEVSASEELRMERTMKRDGVSREQVQARMRNQLPEDERQKRADLVIINDENAKMSELVLAIKEFISKFAAH